MNNQKDPRIQIEDNLLKLETITGLEVTYGGYFGGTVRKHLTFENDTVLVETLGFNGYTPDEDSYDETKEEFIKKLQSIHMEEWKRSYHDNNVLDGIQWEVILEYESNQRIVYSGSNSFPENFKDFLTIVHIKK